MAHRGEINRQILVAFVFKESITVSICFDGTEKRLC